MDREQIIKELIESDATRKKFFGHIKRIAKDYRVKKESGQVQEFAEFALLRDSIKSTFGLQDSSEQQIVEFVLAVSLALSDAITENNRQWLQALSEEGK